MNFFYSINVNDRYRFPFVASNSNDYQRNKAMLVEDLHEEDLVSAHHQHHHGSAHNKEEEEEIKKIVGGGDADYEQDGEFGEDGEGSLFETFKRENKITNCEKGLFCDDILKFLDGFFQQMKTAEGENKKWKDLQALLQEFTQYVSTNDKHLRTLMKTMNVKQLITPYIELDLPLHIIDEFNRLEQGDPRIHLYQLNPVWGTGIKEFGFFLDRYESTKEVLCMFVWSKIDNGVVPMPAIGLNPYPLCWVCDKGFGTISCNECRVAKYCSKECQLADWIRHGGPMCELMASVLKKVDHLTFK